jgi:hypothetical protein
MQWRSDYCKKHCIPTAVEAEASEDWEMLVEDHSEVYQIGTAVCQDEDCVAGALRLMP